MSHDVYYKICQGTFKLIKKSNAELSGQNKGSRNAERNFPNISQKLIFKKGDLTFYTSEWG